METADGAAHTALPCSHESTCGLVIGDGIARDIIRQHLVPVIAAICIVWIQLEVGHLQEKKVQATKE